MAQDNIGSALGQLAADKNHVVQVMNYSYVFCLYAQLAF